MSKHAYLIIANRNFEQLHTMVKLLDDPRNDIYILIDKKSLVGNLSWKLTKSRLFFIPRIAIYWGEYSQIRAELLLFCAAAQRGGYSYFHLLSGLDLPLASQDDIHAFFDNHQNMEFVTYSAMASQASLKQRLKPHLFRKLYRLESENRVQKFLLRQYRRLESKVNSFGRNPAEKIKFGSNWVSLSSDFVELFTNDETVKDIEQKYLRGYLVDELLFPFLIKKFNREKFVFYGVPVHDHPDEFQGNMRYINWWDGSPYVWREKDMEQLKAAKHRGFLFARKFDAEVDSKIIDFVIHKLAQ